MPSDVLTCHHFPACSGCTAIGVPYAEQLERKRQYVRSRFADAHLPGFDPDSITHITPSPRTSAYRNRVRLVPRRGQPDGRLELGLFRAGTHEVVDIPGCPIQLPGINEAVEVLRTLIAEHGVALYDEITHGGDLRFISIRQGHHTGEILVGLVTRAAEFPQSEAIARSIMQDLPRVVGVVQNINPQVGNIIFGSETRTVAGRPYIHERANDVTLRLGLTNFFQVNTPVAEAAYRAIHQHLGADQSTTLIDLYAGVGAIGLTGAGRARQIIGIEESAEAIEHARAAADDNGFTNTEFRSGLVEDALPDLLGGLRPQGISATDVALVVNPPRRGLGDDVAALLADARGSRIAYLSCYPPSLLRDLRTLIAGGFRMKHVQLFDMFPQTPLVETLVILQR